MSNFESYIPEDVIDDGLKNKMDVEDKLVAIKNAKQEAKLTWLESEIFKYYFEDNLSLRKVASKLGISHIYVWQKLNKIKEKIIKKI